MTMKPNIYWHTITKSVACFLCLLIPAGFFTFPAAAQQREAPDTIESFPVGNQPSALAFDGANIWVLSSAEDSVTKLRASDGALVGTFPAGGPGYGAAFDGANVWIANLYNESVTKLRASDGAILGSFALESNPNDVLFESPQIVRERHGHTGDIAPRRIKAASRESGAGREPFLATATA